MDLPTRLDLFGIGASYVQQRARRIDPAQVLTEGSDVNIVVGSVSVIADAIVRQLAYSSARLFAASADGEDLDRLALDRYGMARKGASAAVGRVRFFRTSAALGAGSVPAGTLLRTLGNIQYVTTTTASFAASQTDRAFASVRAVQAGKATQVGANQVAAVAQPGALWDSTVQCNNDLAVAGGEDAEDDDTFRARIQSFWLTARRGTLGAIEFGALTVPGVVTANAVEVTDPSGSAARLVLLYISDSSGVASQQLADLVTAALLDYRAAGIQVLVSTSTPLIVAVVLSLTFEAGVDTEALAEAVRAAVVDFVNNLPVNGPLYLSQLQAVLARFADDGLVPNASSIATPVGDLIPAVGQTLRATFDSVTLAA